MNFSKMHGLGNDFMIIDAITQNVHLSPKQIARLADRNTGVGFDQLILVEPPYSPNHDFHYRIYNADGSEVGQCGNGARCFAQFVLQKGLTKKKHLKISTQSGVLTLTQNPDDTVTVNMGIPQFDPSKIPFKAVKEEKTYIIRTDDQTVFCGVVSMGNPHCVIVVEDILNVDMNCLGPLLEHHERFPEKTNIGFMQRIDETHIKLRVFERSVGETKACGSGACAAVAIGIVQDLLASNVDVVLPGGTLHIQWAGPNEPLYMTGTATHVFDGFITLYS